MNVYCSFIFLLAKTKAPTSALCNATLLVRAKELSENTLAEAHRGGGKKKKLLPVLLLLYKKKPNVLQRPTGISTFFRYLAPSCPFA